MTGVVSYRTPEGTPIRTLVYAQHSSQAASGYNPTQNSGGRWGSVKETTSDHRQLDLRRWYRDGYLVAGWSFFCRWTRLGEVVRAGLGLQPATKGSGGATRAR